MTLPIPSAGVSAIPHSQGEVPPLAGTAPGGGSGLVAVGPVGHTGGSGGGFSWAGVLHPV